MKKLFIFIAQTQVDFEKFSSEEMKTFLPFLYFFLEILGQVEDPHGSGKELTAVTEGIGTRSRLPLRWVL